MRNTTRRRPRKRAISSIIGTVFLILIILVAFAVFTVMFNSFASYNNTLNQVSQQNIQNQQTSLETAMQFGSPQVLQGSMNPPTFNVNSIGSSTTANPTHYAFERKVVYSQGYWWAFFSGGTVATGIELQVSPDGITWEPAQTLITGTGTNFGYTFSVWLGSGGILYYVFAPYNSGSTMTVGSVPLLPSGTVGTVATLPVTLPTNYETEGYGSITNDTSGNIWVALNIYKNGDGNPHDRALIAYRCTATLSGCTAEDITGGTPTLNFGNNHDITSIIMGLSNGAIAIIYEDSGSTGHTFTAQNTQDVTTCVPGTANGQCQGGSSPITWGSPVVSTLGAYADHISAVAIGNTAYLSGETSAGLQTWNYTYGNAATSAVTLIDGSVTGTASLATISENGAGSVLGTGNNLSITYGTGTNVYFTSSTDDSTWTTPATISTSETAVTGITSTYSGLHEGAIWTSGNANPYTVRFFEINSYGFNPTQIAPSTVSATTTSGTATGVSSEDKLVYGSGLWWDFYSAGSAIDYATSSDGITWSAGTQVTTAAGATSGSDFSVCLSGTTLYWVLSTGGTGATFVWGYGILQSSGTVSFTTSGNIATTYTTENEVSIETDSAGNTWVALTTLQGGTTYYIEVYEHANGAAVGTWSTNLAPSSLPTLTATANSILLPSGASPGAILLAETTGSIPSGSSAGTGVVSIYSTTVTSGWTSSTWTSAVSPTSQYALAISSAVLVGNVVYFAGLASSTAGQASGTLNLWSYTAGASSTSTETVIESSINPWRAAIGSYDNTLYLFDSSYSLIRYYYSGNQGYTWSSPSNATYYEPDIGGLTAADGPTIAVTWTDNNISPYTVRFASLSSLLVTDNSAYSVHIVSMYITNPSTNSLLRYYYTNSTNSTELLDYWLGPGTSQAVVLSFAWAVTTQYVVTFATSTGVIEAQTFTSPA